MTFSVYIVLALMLFSPVSTFSNGFNFYIIVHKENPINAINRKVLGNIFLKKMKLWDDGKIAIPVDLNQNSSARKEFSESVLDRPVSAVGHYWQQMIFSGRDVPPPEFDSDQKVINYVKKHKTAIGYISSRDMLDKTDKIKVIPIY